MPDYVDKARKLRAKAADPTVTAEERESFMAKAREFEAKAIKQDSRFTDDTTVTGRDGRSYNERRPFVYWNSASHYGKAPQYSQESEDILYRLFFMQPTWNRSSEDEDIIEEDYREQEDEEAGYDRWNDEPL